ncbi:hypothetical protein [Adlercreutzia mucosicola]|uniref:hypothetical protein n=1 Tax=Adlercreutzia mucosicola TaxID=580026 RepID=UPI000419B6AA|nr:hypothetical protein [Adlercreutzia mucosicola]MCR2036356.1 hypothetical protein [Adlercreutzia mucosicola]
MEKDASEEAMITQDEMAVRQALCEATVQTAELIAEALKREKYQAVRASMVSALADLVRAWRS